MSDFLRRLKGAMKSPYKVTLEIEFNDVMIHQAEIEVLEYNKHRANKEAMKKAAEVSSIKVVGCRKRK